MGPRLGGLGRGAWAWARGVRTDGWTDGRTDGQNILCILQNIAPLGQLPKKEIRIGRMGVMMGDWAS